MSFSEMESRQATAFLGTTVGGEAVLTHVLAMLSWEERDECILPAEFLGNGNSTGGTCIKWRNAGGTAFGETVPRDVFGPISPSCIREPGVETLSWPGGTDDFLVKFKNKFHFPYTE